MHLSMTKCKKRLATLWLTGSGILFFLLFLQTCLGRYGIKAKEAWGWLLPTIMPTLSLMLGVLIMDASGKGVQTRIPGRFVFHVSFGLSIFYLIVVALTILLQPVTKLSPLEWMNQSNLWLGPLQGLVSASIGVFFVKREQA